jgi:hypothetical protein
MPYDLNVLESMGKIAGIGGLGVAAFLLIFRSVIRNKKLFTTMNQDQTFRTIHKILYLAFAFGFIGIAAWIYSNSLNPNRGVSTPKEFTFTGQDITFAMLPSAIVDPPSAASGKALLDELARKGSLTLDHSTLTIAPTGANDSAILAVHTLRLMNGSRIVTNGNGLRLIAAQIIANESSVISFPDAVATLPDAPQGSAGSNGHDGGKVTLQSIEGMQGTLIVSLPGQNGARGGQGAFGAQGNPGPRGSDAVQGFVDCRAGGGNGGQGGQGQPGQPGSQGGNGGAGGTLSLEGKLVDQRSLFIFSALGGHGGAGGAGGLGGPGGGGGQGGSGSASCSGGRGGEPGPSGIQGTPGTPGSDGENGRETFSRN